MALKRRQAEASKDAAVSPACTSIYIYMAIVSLRGAWLIGTGQNEYSSILAKRVNEEKAKKTELRSKSILHLSTWQGVNGWLTSNRAKSVVDEEVDGRRHEASKC